MHNRPIAFHMVFGLIILACALLAGARAWPGEAPVDISETESSYMLDNGLVRVTALKNSGDLTSLKYKGLEMLNAGSGRAAGYWSHNVERGRRSAHITIDPKSNGGERAEVSMKGEYTGVPLGAGPGGSAVADIEIRYALERGTPGVFTYSIFDHSTNYPATSVGEARFCAKLNDDLFDWMTVDANRNLQMLTAYDWNHGTVMNMKEARRLNTGTRKGNVEHKYDYAANQFEVRAWGWTSTARSVGVWLVNPSVEYLSGGPTKFELCAHRDATFGTNLTAPAPPTLLNYWRSSHYGGSVCAVAKGEQWTKVIGPFLIYCNSGNERNELWQNALARASGEAAKWPYDWVSGVDYPVKNQRATVNGRLLLRDLAAPDLRLTRLLVGLTPPDTTATYGFDSGRIRTVDWQQNAKGYQFWTRGDSDGSFSIRHVRPGNYSLHALADGVLGEFTLTHIAVGAGETVHLGALEWQPVRYGKQLWDIGIPNRSGSEFFKGDDYFHWGWYLEYPKLFPEDVRFEIGKSDFRKEWFFEQVPHNEEPDNASARRPGRSTAWKVLFDLPAPPRGKATLRLAICGVGTRTLSATLNGSSIGSLTGLMNNSTILRDGIAGTWSEHDLVFNASLLKAGKNELQLIIPDGNLANGIIYDYLRLEAGEKPEK